MTSDIEPKPGDLCTIFSKHMRGQGVAKLYLHIMGTKFKVFFIPFDSVVLFLEEKYHHYRVLFKNRVYFVYRKDYKLAKLTT